MSDELKRIECTYRNDFGDAYPASCDESPDGDYYFADNVDVVIESLQRQVAELEKSLGIDAVEGLETENFQLEQEIINLKAKLTANSDEFKNFHRMLCERFGYTHDEKDWRRDQVSLIEYLATANSERAAEPVAVIGSNFQLLWCREDWSQGVKVGDKLYTSPQASQQPVEAIARLNYFFRQIDGTYVFPTPCHPQIRQVLEALIDYATPTNKADLIGATHTANDQQGKQ